MWRAGHTERACRLRVRAIASHAPRTFRVYPITSTPSSTKRDCIRVNLLLQHDLLQPLTTRWPTFPLRHYIPHPYILIISCPSHSTELALTWCILLFSETYHIFFVLLLLSDTFFSLVLFPSHACSNYDYDILKHPPLKLPSNLPLTSFYPPSHLRLLPLSFPFLFLSAEI